jgi:hypothetical protein
MALQAWPSVTWAASASRWWETGYLVGRDPHDRRLRRQALEVLQGVPRSRWATSVKQTSLHGTGPSTRIVTPADYGDQCPYQEVAGQVIDQGLHSRGGSVEPTHC